MRTLDLLDLAALYLSGKLQADDVAALLTQSRGWLRVGDTVEWFRSEAEACTYVRSEYSRQDVMHHPAALWPGKPDVQTLILHR